MFTRMVKKKKLTLVQFTKKQNKNNNWEEIDKDVNYGKTVTEPMYTNSEGKTRGVCVLFWHSVLKEGGETITSKCHAIKVTLEDKLKTFGIGRTMQNVCRIVCVRFITLVHNLTLKKTKPNIKKMNRKSGMKPIACIQIMRSRTFIYPTY